MRNMMRNSLMALALSSSLLVGAVGAAQAAEATHTGNSGPQSTITNANTKSGVTVTITCPTHP